MIIYIFISDHKAAKMGKGRPKKGLKKSGSYKKSLGNPGATPKLRTKSASKAPVGRDHLSPSSRSKYFSFHRSKLKERECSEKGGGNCSRRLYGNVNSDKADSGSQGRGFCTASPIPVML